MRMNHNTNNIKLYACLYIVLIVDMLGIACTELPPPLPDSSIQTQEEMGVDDAEIKSAYPSASNTTENAYPIVSREPTAQLNAYPSPLDGNEFQEPRFHIDFPQTAGNTTVTGQAPPNLSIAVVDVTFNGIVLGGGVSDDNGRFSIGVNSLQQGNRIGITFAELEAGKSFNDMAITYFPHRGEEFMNIPNVGIFFDTTIVE